MKSGLAAILFADGALAGSGQRLSGDLILAGMVGEEVDCLGANKLAEDGILEGVNDRAAVSTPADDPFVQLAQQAGRRLWSRELKPKGVTYYTDASVLAPACGKPVLIFGPGQAEQAHQTDEWVGIEDIYRAAKFYLELSSKWSG